MNPTAAMPSPFEPGRPRFGAALRDRHRPLAVAALLILAIGACLSIGLFLDGRTLHGHSVWMKPVKFHLSVALHLGTLAWVAGLLPERTRAGWFVAAIAGVAIAASTAELLYIDVQGARGFDSHFNESTPLSTWLFRAMGVVAVLLAAASLGFAWMVARSGHARLAPATRDAVVLGLVLTFVLGAGVGAAMGANGSHGVGGTPDQAGLPLLGWVRDGGDLRVAHFFGIHAMQILPLAGFALAAALPAGLAREGVWAFALLYAVFTSAVFMQALAGQPFLAGLPF